MKKKLERDAKKKESPELLILTSHGTKPGAKSTAKPALVEPVAAVETPAKAPAAAATTVKAAPVGKKEAVAAAAGAAAVVVATSATALPAAKKEPEPVVAPVAAPVVAPASEPVVEPLRVSDPAEFPALVTGLQSRAEEAVSFAVKAQDEAAAAIKSPYNSGLFRTNF